MPLGGFGFDGFNLMFGLMSMLFFVLFGVAIVRMITVWSKNNASPRLTVAATVVAKRTRVRHDGDGSSTRYYATFQFESGDRLELHIPHNQIGYLVEGDGGMLTFQGTRYLGFERT